MSCIDINGNTISIGSYVRRVKELDAHYWSSARLDNTMAYKVTVAEPYGIGFAEGRDPRSRYDPQLFVIVTDRAPETVREMSLKILLEAGYDTL